MLTPSWSRLLAAPVMEELTLRGLLQPWLARYSWGGLLAVGAPLAWWLIIWPSPDSPMP